MRKISSALFASALTLALATSGCSAGGTASESDDATDELTMLVTSSPSAKGLQELAGQYKSETGVSVKFVEVPGNQLATKIILAKQAGQASFDIAQFDAFTMPQIVATGALAPLDEFLEADEQYDVSDFPEAILDYGKQDGTSYGVALSTEPYLQWYRTDLFDSLGLQPASTWADAIKNAEALTNSGYYGWATAFGPVQSAHFFNEMLTTSGGRLLDEETYRPLLDSPLATTVMEQFVSMNRYSPESSSTGGQPDAMTAFSQLDVGQLVGASGWYSVVNNPENSNAAGKFALAVSPRTDGGEYPSKNVLYGWLAGVSSVSKHKTAAWDFLSWALSKDNVQAFLDAGAPPVARNSTVTNVEFAKQLPYLGALEEATAEATTLPRIAEMPQIVAVLSQNISSIVSGQLSVAEGLEKSQIDLTNILVQSGRYKGQ